MFWTSVLQFITHLTTISIPQQADICILGLAEALALTRVVCTLLGLPLFYARKSIIVELSISGELQLFPPQILGSQLCYSSYKETYMNTGCPKKFNKALDIWL